MESLQSLKLRTKSIKNINQITKAMELVAATKMRRSQEIALSSRPYMFAALDMLANITRLAGVPLPALLTPREVKHTAYVVVTSDKGLAGSFNSAVMKEFDVFARESGDTAHPVSKETDYFIAVGQKAAAYLEKNFALREKFVRAGDYSTLEQVAPICDLLIDGYLRGEWDRVVIVSTHFRSALVQEVLVREVLPSTLTSLQKTADEIVPEAGKFRDLVNAHEIPLFRNDADGKKKHGEAPEYIIEPSPEAILDSLAQRLVAAEIYDVILEANASEHAARRLAMKSASDNAKDLADSLGLLYNKSRQAAITREIIEIVAGAESLT
jgi:F-type H+-transporting ATPase subunit gamma